MNHRLVEQAELIVSIIAYVSLILKEKLLREVNLSPRVLLKI